MKFKNFLINVNSEEFTEQEAPPAAPAAPEAAPSAMPMASPPMPPPPMAGGLDAGLGGGAPPASTGSQVPPIKIKTSNVWEVLKGLLSEKPKDQSTPNPQDVLKNGDKPKHLMGI